MKFGEKLLELRKKHGLSQEELGNRLNVTRQTISNWELGVTSPTAEQLKLLSKELQVSIDELLDNEIKNIVVEKISNTEKLTSSILKIIKFIVLFIVLGYIVLIIFSILFKNINNNQGRMIDEYIDCTLYDEHHSFGIKYRELTGQPIELGGDTYFSDILDLNKYNDAHQIFNVINDYVKRNNGTCEIKESSTN